MITSITWLRMSERDERPSMVSTEFQKEMSFLKARQSKSRCKAETATWLGLGLELGLGLGLGLRLGLGLG